MGFHYLGKFNILMTYLHQVTPTIHFTYVCTPNIIVKEAEAKVRCSLNIPPFMITEEENYVVPLALVLHLYFVQ